MEQGAVIDEVLTALIWNGRYQWTRCALLYMPLLTLALQSVSIVFIGKSVSHQCQPVNFSNVTSDLSYNLSDVHYNVTYRQCSIEVTNESDVIFETNCLNGYDYQESTKSSIVSEWNLVCEREYYSDVTQSVLTAGQTCGFVFLTQLADKYGRKTSLVVSSVLSLSFSLGCSFVPNVIFFAILRFAMGASHAVAYQLAYIPLIEMLPTKHRALAEKISAFLWTASLLLLCLIAYLSEGLSWQYTHLIISLTSVYALFLWCFIDESIRWLCAAKRFNEVEKLVRKMAQINNVDVQKALEILKSNGLTEMEHADNGKVSLYIPLSQQIRITIKYIKTASIVTTIYITNLFIGFIIEMQQRFDNVMRATEQLTKDARLINFVKNLELFKLTCIAIYLWFVDALAYEGLLYNSPDLVDNFYLGFFLGIVIELPSAVIFCLLINRLGRKKCTSIFHLVAGIFLVFSTVLLNTPLSAYIPVPFWISLTMSLIGRLSLNVGYSSTLIYVPELYPTSVRNTGYGISCLGSCLGAIISPYTRTVSRHLPWVPPIVFGIMCLTVPIVIRILPETKGQELVQTIGDMQKQKEENHMELSTKTA